MDLDYSTKSNKFSSLRELSELSREELISQLLAAQKKIHKLESKQGFIQNKYPTRNNALSCEAVSGYPKDDKSQAESMFAYVPSDSSMQSELENHTFEDQKQLVHHIHWKLNESDDYNKPFMKTDDEFIVVYECNGDFPSCDEDFSKSSLLTEQYHDSDIHHKFIFSDETLVDSDDDDNDQSDTETFPLIPSPILNTPPYEYIFLTKANEAKYRIFLNQKLNKVFQGELKKLQLRDEIQLNSQDQALSDETEDDSTDPHIQSLAYCSMDVHNKNHLINTPSANEVNPTFSKPNVIHCFDPSDVDLELKKIFTEKPPITHKIVRRRSRKERGSSVPAVDSYYGTRDLNKVGHASYFIPTLTDSERKAIGWKHDYHYGHWKYTTLSVPNPKKNQIFLHPHVELEEVNDSKNHNNSHRHHSGSLHQNPLHHKEIDLSEPFITEHEPSDDINVNLQKECSKHHHTHNNHQPTGSDNITNEKQDALSFITLSGCSNDMSQSCHIIPDTCTLRRILKWLLPCIKQSAKSNTNSLATMASASHNNDNQDSGDHTRNKEKEKSIKTHHEIETLVEPSGKLNFPASHTYISFVTTPCEDIKLPVPVHISENSVQVERENDGQDDTEVEHQHHEHHHHHHGIFHWKKLSHHGGSSSIESTSVVGGDVLEAVNDNIDKDAGVVHMEPIKNFIESVTEQEMATGMNRGSCFHNSRAPFVQVSSTESESEREDFTLQRPPRNGKGKKLRPCKAYTKLLTLTDLGYESDERDVAETKYVAAELGKEVTIESNTSSCDINSSSTTVEDCEVKREKTTHINNNRRNSSSSRAKSQKINSDGGQIRLSSLSMKHRVHTGNSSYTGMAPENDDTSSGGSAGYPFSSMSISHQNSGISSIDTDIISPTVSKTNQNGIETRFLDPKDTLLEQVGKNLRSHSSSYADDENLPFVFDLDNSPYDGETDFTDKHLDDNVIEWMGCDFVNDMEDGMGLLSSCFSTAMENGKLLKNCTIYAFVTDQECKHKDEEGPEKVRAQHCITTLNAMECQHDQQNQNN